MPDQVSNNPVTTVAIPQKENGIASLDSLSKWILEHQQELENKDKTKIIVLDEKKGDTYKFETAFLIYVLEGDIDLKTNDLTNGNFYVTAPVWGRVNMMDNISGNLSGGIKCEFERGANITGILTLSLDNDTKKLTVEYDFTIKFVGSPKDKLALFPLPASATGPSEAQIAAAKPTFLTCDTYTNEHQLFDKFLEDHYDLDTQNFIIESYKPPEAGAMSSGSKAYTINVSFLSIFELEGSVEPGTFTISATLYVRVPLWGRVKITSISGSLTDGINMSINVLVASGTIGLRLVNGKEVWFKVALNVKFVGDINGDTKLFTLPF